MAKIVLGKRPDSFKKTLKFPMHDGTEGTMEVSYRYRTLTEFGTFIDEWNGEQIGKLDAERLQLEAAKKKALDAGETYVDPQVTNEEVRGKQAKANTDYLMRILVGWNLDVEFSRDAVLQLCDELPGAAIEAMNSYRAAITEGRLGN